MLISVLIIEDEFVISEDIRQSLILNGYTVFGLARTYNQAIELLKKGRPNFALVDITLNGDQSGLELGRMFSEDLNIPFIYITSHSDRATLEKVKLTNPLGFVLKPFKPEAIYTAIEVAMINFNNKTQENSNENNIILKKGDEKLKVNYNEILFMESDANYTHIQTVTSKFTERKTLKQLMEEMVNHPFIRVHKSFSVNKNKIYHFSKEKIFVGGFEVAIGRAYAQEIAKIFTL